MSSLQAPRRVCSIFARLCNLRCISTAALSPVHAQARWAEWGALRCPVDLIRGGQGFMRYEEVARMRELQLGMQVVEVRHAGHDVHLDAPDVVAGVLLQER